MSSSHQANPSERARFNLSRWAIAHPSIARFLFGLIIVMGALGVMNMGQKEDPDSPSASWSCRPSGRVPPSRRWWIRWSTRSSASCRKPRILTGSSPIPAPAWAITTVQIKGDTNTAEVKDASTRSARRSAISTRICRPACSVLFQRRVRRHLHHAATLLSAMATAIWLNRSSRSRPATCCIATPGVEKAVILGDQPQKIFIDVSSKALAERGLTVLNIRDALAGPEQYRSRR